MVHIQAFFSQVGALFANLFERPDWRNIVDIAILTILIYNLIKLGIRTRANSLFKGITVILVLAWISDALQISALSWVLQQIISMGLVVLVIVFQPELRRALDQIGRSRLTRQVFSASKRQHSNQVEQHVAELVRAINNMARKKMSNLQVVKTQDDRKALRQRERRIKCRRRKELLTYIILIAMAICGTYLLLDSKTYGTVRKADSYAKDLSDRNNYVQFADGIVRYNHDGVVFLNKKNEEKWIQPTQLQTPVIVVKDDVFAVADSGGNSILVFTKNGLKGEIQTTLPIERIAVSNQGIVSAILKDETSPKIISYDAAGNILVEQQITIGNTGYPIALDLSDDGKVLAVSYLYTKGTQVQSRIGYYNFDAAGKEKADNKVTADTYEDMLIGEIFFMGNDRSVAVGDNGFEIYTGKDTPKQIKEVKVNQEIKSVFHSDSYFGFVLLNQEKSGYELRMYNRSGDTVFSKEIQGDYSHVKMDGDNIILYDGSKCCIYTTTGILKFKGDLGADAQEIFDAFGLNRYYVMSDNELRIVYLTK